MSTDLRDHLRRLADQWDGMHAPITAEEVFGRFENLAVSDVKSDRLSVSETEDTSGKSMHGLTPHARHRLWRMMIYGSAAATIATGFIVVGATRTAAPVHDTADTPAASSTPGLSRPPDSVPSSSATREPVDETVTPVESSIDPPTTATASTTAPDAASTGDVPSVRQSIWHALAELDSFRATIVSRSYRTHADGTTSDDSTERTTVTWMGDGRLWFEGDDVSWGSFDPSTGAMLRQFIGPDGADHYQRTDGRSMSLGGMFGLEPVTEYFNDESTVEAVSFLDRPAWKINTIRSTPDPTPQEFVVDQATGLTVAAEYSSLQDDETTIHEESEFTSIETDVELPASFPGVFPDGVVVEEPQEPTAERSLGLAEAAATFGHAFYAPADLPSTAFISASNHLIYIRIPIGFTRATIMISDIIPSAQSPTNSSVPVEPSVPGVLSGGALVGQSYEARDGEVQLVYSGLFISIGAATPDMTLDLANSLVLVPH